MVDRRFVHAVNIGGNDYEFHVAADTDRVLGHVKDTDFNGGNQVLVTSSGGQKASVTVGQNQILGQEGITGIRGLTATQVRSILNVQSGAESNQASNLGVAESSQIFGLWEDKDNSVLRFRSIGPLSPNRLKAIKQSTTRILLDPLVYPLTFSVLGNARLGDGDIYAIARMEQSATLREIRAVITSADADNPGLRFRIYRNSIRAVDAGVTIMLDFSGVSNRLTDQDGTGNGYLAAGDDETKFPTASGENVIGAGEWLIFHVIGKTSDSTTGITIDEFHISMYLTPT